MNVLVTGGAGYIGSHTCDVLLKNGYNVFVLDNLSTGFQESLRPEIKFIKGDILDTELVQHTLQTHHIESVVHFAAKLNVKESVVDPLPYYHNNVGGLISVLMACNNAGVKNFIFSSTAAVYGTPSNNLPLLETAEKKPINPYGESKLMCENILRTHSQTSALKFVILRYFNVAGASDDLKNGQRTANAYHLIHVASQAATGKRKQLEIFGFDYKTTDGTCVRDYIHVEDLADLHFLALSSLKNGGPSDIYNCGYGAGYSVTEIVTCAQKLAPTPFEVLKGARRAGDPDFLVADSTKIKTAFKWTPKRNNIEKICKSAIDWELKLS